MPDSATLGYPATRFRPQRTLHPKDVQKIFAVVAEAEVEKDFDPIQRVFKTLRR